MQKIIISLLAFLTLTLNSFTLGAASGDLLLNNLEHQVAESSDCSEQEVESELHITKLHIDSNLVYISKKIIIFDHINQGIHSGYFAPIYRPPAIS